MNDELQILIERFEKAPESRLFAPLADCYRKRGDIERAVEILEKGLERFPLYASARVILGKCFYDTGATERAKAEFTRVLEVDPENLVALKFMGDISLAVDRRDEAAEYFRKIVAIDPTNEEATGALKEMESVFVGPPIDLGAERTSREQSPRELATITLAGIYAAQGYYGKALKIYREILEREPANREAREMMGKLRSIMDSTELEQQKAFDGKILSISLDDVSEDIVSSTAGGGGKEPRAREETVPEPASEEPRPVEGGVVRSPEKEEVASDVSPPADSSADAACRAAEAATDENVNNFRSWLKRLKGR